VEDNGTVTETDYCGPFVYETVSGVRSLKYIVTPEGRAVKNGSSWDFEYNLTDHLGNVRAVIHKGGNGLAEVLQERHYYPFGMEMSTLSSGSSTNKFLYNGKEHQNSLGLDWYDYGARFYDPELGRFHSVDPMAESYYSFSPYHFSGNNPMTFIDSNGMNYSPYYDDRSGRFLGVDENGFTGQIMVTSEKTWDSSSKDKDGAVNSESIAKNSDTKKIQDANLSDESIANVYTDVVSKTNDKSISSAKLYNNSISVFNNKLVNGKAGGFNDPEFARGASHQNMGEKGSKVTMNRNFTSILNTVENAQNTLGAHEILGHGINGIGGDSSGEHYKVYQIQMSHSTWGNTTLSYKAMIAKKYLELLYKENPSKYNSDPNVYKLYQQYGK